MGTVFLTFCPPYWISRYEYIIMRAGNWERAVSRPLRTHSRLLLKKLRLLKTLKKNPELPLIFSQALLKLESLSLRELLALVTKPSSLLLAYSYVRVWNMLSVTCEDKTRISINEFDLVSVLSNTLFFQMTDRLTSGMEMSLSYFSHSVLLTSPSSRALSCSAFCSFILKSFICLLNSPGRKGKDSIIIRKILTLCT